MNTYIPMHKTLAIKKPCPNNDTETTERERSCPDPAGSQPLNEVTMFGVGYDDHMYADDGTYLDDEYLDNDREPDGYECEQCGNVQEYGHGSTCNKCMGSCDEFYF